MREDAFSFVANGEIGSEPDTLGVADDGPAFIEGEDVGEKEGSGDAGDLVSRYWDGGSRGEGDGRRRGREEECGVVIWREAIRTGDGLDW